MTTFDSFPTPSKSVIRSYDSLRKKTFFTKADYPITAGELSGASIGLAFAAEWVRYIATRVLPGPRKIPPNIRQLPRSTFHSVHSLRTAGHAYVLKLNAFPEYFRDCSFYLEQWANDQLSQAGLPFVRTIMIDATRESIPTDYLVQEAASGKSLLEVNNAGKLTPELLSQLGNVMAAVHSVPVTGYGQFSVGSLLGQGRPSGMSASWNAFLESHYDDHVAYCIRLGIFREKSKTVLRKLLADCQDRTAWDQPRLLHGDIANHNVFTARNTISGVIDWEDAIAGDPVYDISYWATASFQHPEWVEFFLQGYTPVRALPDDYELRFWWYYFRISLAKTVLRFKLGYDADSRNASGPQRLRGSLSVLERLLYNSQVLSACMQEP